MLNSAEHYYPVNKYYNANFEIYQQDKFHVQLSRGWKKSFIILGLVVWAQAYSIIIINDNYIMHNLNILDRMTNANAGSGILAHSVISFVQGR